jgi:hypothetical protein
LAREREWPERQPTAAVASVFWVTQLNKQGVQDCHENKTIDDLCDSNQHG